MSRPSLSPSPTRRRHALIAAPILLLAAAACADGGVPDAESREPELPRVRAAAVQTGAVQDPVRAAGTFAPAREVTLAFRVGGVVDAVEVDAGDGVAAGRLLARLDLQEIDAAVARAESAWEKASRDRERAERLYADSVVSLSAVQDARTAARVAEADLSTARFNRRHAEIRAPAAGDILERLAEPGESVAPGTAILRFGSRSAPGLVRVALADRDRVRVRVGDTATVRFDALPDREIPGRVTRVGAAASPATGTWEVEVTLEPVAAPGPGPVPGMVGEVLLFPAGTVSAALIPVEALVEADGQEGVVYALESGGDGPARAVRRELRLGALHGDRVAVLAGLDGVTSVVTGGGAWLADGAPVEVVR